jgi:hypothetical protein
MPVRGALLSLLLTAFAAGAAELHTVKGEKISGELVRITDKEIVLKEGDKEVVTPAVQVLFLDFPGNAPVKLEDKYSDVELTDGTLLHCKEVLIKGKQVEMRTLSGQEIKVPLASVSNLLTNAQEEKYRKDWTERVSRKRNRDVLAVLKDGIPNPLEGTLADGNEAGTHITFTLGDKTREVGLDRIHGLIFLREIDPNAPVVLCKLTDTHRNLIMVSGASVTPTGLTVTTPCGAKIDYPAALVAKLDYSTDKVVYLSHLEPVSVVQPDSPFDQYRRDRNLDNGPLKLDEVYPLGLAMHATTELEYDLKGDYREFQAKAGIDYSVGGHDGPVVLRIEGDGKELYTHTFNRKQDKDKKDQGPVPITLNIKDVSRLRLIVTSGDGSDLGRHLHLANAKVSK